MRKEIGYLIGFVLLFLNVVLEAQYFGRNKPGYDVFEYKVYSTPNFEIYHNLGNDSVLNDLAQKSEQWYSLHQYFFKDTLYFKNPLILYNDHGDFQQNNVSSGSVGIGTGGFTEGMKNRVVLPVSQTSEQTDHVLGHELVHAFQYNYLLNKSGVALQDLNNIPLWMIEGMAEYLSIGSIDPNTAMWLRDDVLNNNLPSLAEMSSSNKYNPYRYGMAFWAFTANKWGDDYYGPLLTSSSKSGYQKAMMQLFKVKPDPPKRKIGKRKPLKRSKRRKQKSRSATDTVKYESFDSVWHECIRNYYLSIMPDTVDDMIGRVMFDSKNAGDYNISPVISPNGEMVIFMSEKELFSIDLFLADMISGKILGSFTKRVNENEIDAFNFIESAGTWSPDSRYFAYSAYKKGRNVLLVIDAKKRKVIKEFAPEGIEVINNPAWGPNNKIAFSALINGISKIYILDMNDGGFEEISHVNKSCIQPSWSRNGENLVFITELDVNDSSKYIRYSKNIALYDLKNKSTDIIDVFNGAGNYNPIFTPDNQSVLFLSDRDGYRNLYRYQLNSSKVFQLTHYLTGIAGMTMSSPAISMADDGTVVYSYYSDHKYAIYRAHISEFESIEVDPQQLDYSAAVLPSVSSSKISMVNEKLEKRPVIDSQKDNAFSRLPYRPRFQLDYVSNINVGVSTGFMNPGAAGGFSFLCSDIVGDNKLFVNLSLNGQVYDFGGVVAFVNQKKPFNYGISISHIPYTFGYSGQEKDTVTVDDQLVNAVDNYIDLYRIFESQVMLFGYYPISTTMRLEAAVSATRYGYRLERHSYNYYQEEDDGLYEYAGYEKEVLDGPDPMGYFSTEMAFVIDNSDFGLTAPLRGTRARFEVSKNYGYYNYYSTLLDFRKYFFKKPIGFAFRLLNYNRLGATADKNVYNSLFLGYPWYVRGYESSMFNANSGIEQEGLGINHLSGSKMVVANAEIRLPFTGPEKLTMINSRFLFSDLNLFIDAGLAWDNQSSVLWQWTGSTETKRIPVVSVGLSLRINLFGYMVLEPYYALPFQLNKDLKRVIGFNFIPGW